MESPSSRCSESDKLRLVKRSRLELLGSPRSDRDPFGSPKSIGVSSLWGDFPDLFVERERSSSTVDFHFFTKRVGERVGKGVSHVIHTFLANLTLAVRFPSELLPSETGTVVASLLHRGSSNDDLGVSVLQAFIQPENSRAALLKLAEADPLLFEILCNFLPSFVGVSSLSFCCVYLVIIFGYTSTDCCGSLKLNQTRMQPPLSDTIVIACVRVSAFDALLWSVCARKDFRILVASDFRFSVLLFDA